jgi:hypothetical protein
MEKRAAGFALTSNHAMKKRRVCRVKIIMGTQNLVNSFVNCVQRRQGDNGRHGYVSHVVFCRGIIEGLPRRGISAELLAHFTKSVKADIKNSLADAAECFMQAFVAAGFSVRIIPPLCATPRMLKPAATKAYKTCECLRLANDSFELIGSILPPVQLP